MQTLRQIKPLHPPLTPPEGAVAAGVTPFGAQLYRLTRRRARAVPDLDEKGEQKWRINRVTGEAAYRLYKPEVYDEHLLFYLHSQGNGNVSMVEWTPPTPEELAAQERERQIKQMMPAVAAAFVDKGITPEQLADWVRGGMPEPAVAEAEVTEPPKRSHRKGAARPAEVVHYPLALGPDRWLLSDGSAFSGDLGDAEAAEAEAQAVVSGRRAEQERLPSY